MYFLALNLNSKFDALCTTNDVFSPLRMPKKNKLMISKKKDRLVYFNLENNKQQ
jgi:hypothetical protein